MSTALNYVIFAATTIAVLKEFNTIVAEPYMDEPFHVPQAQAYCQGDYYSYDPKLTTPPGLYILSLLLHRVFVFKCTLPLLRLTTALSLLALPSVLTPLLAFHSRRRPPSFPRIYNEALVVSAFPVAWFFAFLYYTELPSLVTVLGTIAAAINGKHWIAAFLGVLSCTFRQTNIIWVLYAYGVAHIMQHRFRRTTPKLYDPPALEASPRDIPRIVASLPAVLPDLLRAFIPYSFVFAAFGVFLVWNGGIVLGDKSNHIPTLHIPQIYYFIAAATLFGWPILISGPLGVKGLLQGIFDRMLGNKKRVMATIAIGLFMAITVHLFTIHHPFLLSDNRHYTFYVWRRIYMFHPIVPYFLIPIYQAAAWAWFLRISEDQTILQVLVLPILLLPTLLPTPLLEPRYFIVPYILLRAQVSGVPSWAVLLEGAWYALIDAATAGVFLYKERPGVGRFMW